MGKRRSVCSRARLTHLHHIKQKRFQSASWYILYSDGQPFISHCVVDREQVDVEKKKKKKQKLQLAIVECAIYPREALHLLWCVCLFVLLYLCLWPCEHEPLSMIYSRCIIGFQYGLLYCISLSLRSAFHFAFVSIFFFCFLFFSSTWFCFWPGFFHTHTHKNVYFVDSS